MSADLTARELFLRYLELSEDSQAAVSIGGQSYLELLYSVAERLPSIDSLTGETQRMLPSRDQLLEAGAFLLGAIVALDREELSPEEIAALQSSMPSSERDLSQ